MKKTLLMIGLVAVAVGGAVLPALAQDGDSSSAGERTDTVRTFPPAWVDMSIEDLQADVEERAERAIVRVEDSPWLSEVKRSELLVAIDGLTASVAGAQSKAEVVGLSISRAQLQRSEIRAHRRDTTIDHEAHIAGDAERAARRLDRIAKVTGWAEAAGEEVGAIHGYLDEANERLNHAYGHGTVEDRHDAVHISLAWLVEAAVALDRL